MAPCGFVFPNWKARLDYEPEGQYWVNEEVVIARLWDRHNRVGGSRQPPVQTIVHEILPALASANRLTDGDFWHGGLPYLTRDVLVLSSTLQWFGTNIGRCFLETDISKQSIRGYRPEHEFIIKLSQASREKGDMVAFFVHVCSERCTVWQPLAAFGGGCCYDKKQVSARDRVVVDGLMRWLGTEEGRLFVKRFVTLKGLLWDRAHRRRRARLTANR